jgi:hypothetical protein
LVYGRVPIGDFRPASFRAPGPVQPGVTDLTMTTRGETIQKHVMLRLDRTIGFPKRVLTGLFGQMARSSRTMTISGGQHTPLDTLFDRDTLARDHGQAAGTSPSPPWRGAVRTSLPARISIGSFRPRRRTRVWSSPADARFSSRPRRSCNETTRDGREFQPFNESPDETSALPTRRPMTRSHQPTKIWINARNAYAQGRCREIASVP